MMEGIHHMEQLRFGDTHHFELQPQGTDAHPDPQTSCTANYDIPGEMEQDLQHIYNNYNALQEMVDIETPVVLNPEVLMCGTNLHPEPQLTFSSDEFKMEYADPDSGQDGDLVTILWEVSDIISIDCKWIQMVHSALITLHVRSSAETVNSGPVKVEFCLADPQWEWKQQKIWQLDSRYKEVWKNIQSVSLEFLTTTRVEVTLVSLQCIIPSKMIWNIIFNFAGKFLSHPIHASAYNPNMKFALSYKDDFASQNWSTDPSLCFPKQYFHGIDDFEDVIYPKGDRDAVSISTRDVDLLRPEIFVNDTIIDFYIKYLTQRIEPTERHRYHFFSSFFFRKLADLDKDQENAPKGREAFLHVRKWTRKIDIFAKEFLLIPVNFSLHWSLLVICYPGEVNTFKDGDARIAGKLPCIMHMNSIKGTHTGLKDIIQSYLWEEWKERHPESASDSSDKFLNLRFLSLELPQQDNVYDCGLFLLHYVERFLMDAPRFFNPMKIDIYSSFLGDDWFVPAEASLKRSVIRKLIHELVTEPSKTYPKLVLGGEEHDERHHRSENAVGEPSREFLGQGCFAAEPDSVCRILGGHKESKLIRLNDSENGLSVPGCFLETGGVSMFAQQEMQMCPSDDDIVVCSPSRDAKTDPFFAYSGNQLGPKSCAPEEAEEFKGSCSVVQDKNIHQESLLDILESNQKISSHAEVEVHEHDTMLFKCCPFSDNLNKVMACQGSINEVDCGRCEASQDMDSVTMLGASKHDTGTDQESAEGKAGNGRCDLLEDTDFFATDGISKDVAERPLGRDIVENMDDRCDLSEDTCSITIGDINKGVAECFSKRNIVEAVDPMALQVDIKALETSTATDKINYSEQYVSSESKDGNLDSILTSGSAVSSWLKEGNIDNVIACESTNGTGETHADDKSDSVFTVLGTQQEFTLSCSSDSEKGLPVPAHTSESGGVSVVAIEETRVCPPNSAVAVCLPCQDTKNESVLTCSGNQLDLRSCAQEDAEAFKESCKVLNAKDTQGESLLNVQNKKQKIFSEAEVEVHQHDIMDSKCFSFSDNVGEVMACHEFSNDRCGAPQDTHSVLMHDASKNEIGLSQESTKGEADDGRHNLSEDTYSVSMSGMKTDAAEHSFERNIVKAMDDRCDLSEDARSVMIDDMNIGVAECLSERSTVEVGDPGAVEDDTKAEKSSATTGTINGSEQYVSSESNYGNSGSIISIGSTVSCGLKEGNVAGGTINGTSETHAHGENAYHNLATGEVVPCEDDTTCTDAKMPHVNGISSCSETEGTYSEKATSNARRPVLGSTSEDKSILVSDDMCSLKGVQCTEDGIIKGRTKEETSTISDKVHDSRQYASSGFRDGNTDNAIAGESTQGTDADGHELAAFPCEDGSDAQMPPHVDGTCSAEGENNSISDGVCEAKKMQVSEEFRSTSEDDIIEGSTKEETSTIPNKNNDSTQYASSELRDANTDDAIAGESTHGSDADDHEFAAFHCEGGSDAEMPPHIDGTCRAEGENNSISHSVCEAKKMQVSEEFRSTSEDDTIIEGSTQEETDRAVVKMNGTEQYASSELEDGKTNRAGSGSEQHDVTSQAQSAICSVGAKRPFPDSSTEAVTLDDMFWRKYSSERMEARFGRWYKRRIVYKRRPKVYKRRKVISSTPPSTIGIFGFGLSWYRK